MIKNKPCLRTYLYTYTHNTHTQSVQYSKSSQFAFFGTMKFSVNSQKIHWKFMIPFYTFLVGEYFIEYIRYILRNMINAGIWTNLNGSFEFRLAQTSSRWWWKHLRNDFKIIYIIDNLAEGFKMIEGYIIFLKFMVAQFAHQFLFFLKNIWTSQNINYLPNYLLTYLNTKST